MDNKYQNWRKVENFDLSDLDKLPLEQFNQTQLWLVDKYHPWEGTCQNREIVTDQFLRKCSKVQKGHNFDLLTFNKAIPKEASCKQREKVTEAFLRLALPP